MNKRIKSLYLFTRRTAPSGYHIAKSRKAKTAHCGAEVEGARLEEIADKVSECEGWLGWCGKCLEFWKTMEGAGK